MEITLSSEAMSEIDWTEICLALEIPPEQAGVKIEAKIIYVLDF